MSADEAALLAEANRLNYRLRSTFFYRKLKDYTTLTFPSLVARLFPVEHLYLWAERADWGIAEAAFAAIQGHPDLHLIQVFCHPKLLREQPQLMAYYRNIAVLSQKAVSYLAGVDVKRFETDPENRATPTQAQALKLARLFNEHVSLIVESALQQITREELYGLLLASTGAQIDGAWRNAIGDEAEKVGQRLLIKEARKRALLAALLPRTGTGAEVYDPAQSDEQPESIERYRGMLLSNGASMLFSSEPDASLLNAQGATLAVLEVKGGADPAGALERYGAAKKSFEQARREHPQVATFLIASCITAEVHTRIRQDATISAYYNLTELLSEGDAYNALMQHVFSLLEGSKAG
jgi:hypothetical protein